MEKYDYMAHMMEDIGEYIKDEIDMNDWEDNIDKLEDHLYEVLWLDDGVTGNASGSYTFSTW